MHTAEPDIRILPLDGFTDRLPELASLFVAEWEPYYGKSGPGNALEDLTACCNHDELPIALVALDTEERLRGTAALKEVSVGSKPGQSPWLAALVVGPQYRGCGVGTRLVAAIWSEARRRGFDRLYISTDTAGTIVKKLGWLPLDTVASLRGPITVYRCDLNTR